MLNYEFMKSINVGSFIPRFQKFLYFILKTYRPLDINHVSPIRMTITNEQMLHVCKKTAGRWSFSFYGYYFNKGLSPFA